MRKTDYPEDPNSIGEVIRKARMDKKMSLRELAEKIKISQSYLWDVEEGKKTPTWDIALQIAKQLGIEFDPFTHTIEFSKPFSAPTTSTVNIEVLKKIFIIPPKKSNQKKNKSI